MALQVNWQFGEPPKEGGYLVTYHSPVGDFVEFAIYDENGFAIYQSTNFKVVAWIPIEDIKPYKQDCEL